ncbi:Phospholipid-transporting ATPase DNF1 [Choanephora cucurbitarum]|uniref:Phospholipid-transporting ATPase n=1 Tax=Choanephora cucurbitarum TaxID=101091 RepID=A0A1C7NRS4_9FUNG|nr:Phospholipid-transporting ATPase DNF1 [Choanephora cucurbitarum]
MSKRLGWKALFSKRSSSDEEADRIHRTESTSSYMQRRKIYVNMKPPASDYDEKGRLIGHSYVPNRIRTAKYTPLSFIPKNLFEQFRNVANLYFLFLVILQCFPIFGVVEPAVSALPIIAILIITGIKDAIEDTKRNKSDQRVNRARTLTLIHWKNVNLPEQEKGRFHTVHVLLGFFCMLAGVDNRFTHTYRMAFVRKPSQPVELDFDRPLNQVDENTSEENQSTSDNQPSSSTFYNKVRLRSGTFRTDLNGFFKSSSAAGKQIYRPGIIPHSVLHRTTTASIRRRSSSVHINTDCSALSPDEPPSPECKVGWQYVQWQDVQVGDYVMIQNDEEVPADIIILSTSEKDNLCYVETQNLDGETNLKVRQGLKATGELRTVHDCERAYFYFESEPPNVNLYQYNGVMRWDIEQPDGESTVTHQKTEAVTYNNLLLRGCVLRNTRWAIGVIVYTGAETKIMLNSGSTPSKRSKMSKATNPYVVANFCILAILCIISSVLSSVNFNASGSSRYFDYGIEGTSASYLGFITFWVTLILYQNIVPISLYISVEIVKTLVAYFVYADLDMYHEPTDAPCIPKTWNICDDLGQIEYIFSDKTGTLTQNVMESRKATINGISYGMGKTEASAGADIRQGSDISDMKQDDLDHAREIMYSKQATLFENKYIGPNPTLIDPAIYNDLERDDLHAASVAHFFSALALCHTALADRPDRTDRHHIEYKAQSPDESALVASARDLGFVFLGRESNVLTVEVMGRKKKYDLLNVLEFNSNRKRMSVIVKPHESDRIVLLCKGADSVIYDRLCTDFGDQHELDQAQARLREITLEHLEGFANEGLRTLCLAYRFISQREYRSWNRRFQEASAAIYSREDRIEEICEEIEVNMLLMGGTAIEDRLQDGVPETIAELSRSGIKLWVLTGDKTETAINIGFSCNLITLDMELVVVKAEDRESTASELERALERVDRVGDTKRCALVIDGITLKFALEPQTETKLLDLGTRCASVVCCRVSPKQKAQVVRLVKKGLRVMTLAIGDGANDVSMIQEANVGVGISGVEGRQAVMASDYAIAQFRFLQKLLLVHGRWSYLRIAEMVMGFFFKNIVWTFVLFWYQLFCQFNGSMMFEYVLVTLYNVVFTSLPIIFMGIWDQDLNAKVSSLYPELYRMGLRNDKFKTWRFYLTVLDGIYQSSVCFFFPYMLLLGGPVDPEGRDQNGMYSFGTIVSSIVVIVANLFVVVSLYSFTWIQILVISLSILVYYVIVCIYAQFNTFLFAGQHSLFGTGNYWMTLILTIVACFLPRVVAKHYRHQYRPYDNDIIREQELVLHQGRSSQIHNDSHGSSLETKAITQTSKEEPAQERPADQVDLDPEIVHRRPSA